MHDRDTLTKALQFESETVSGRQCRRTCRFVFGNATQHSFNLLGKFNPFKQNMVDENHRAEAMDTALPFRPLQHGCTLCLRPGLPVEDKKVGAIKTQPSLNREVMIKFY